VSRSVRRLPLCLRLKPQAGTSPLKRADATECSAFQRTSGLPDDESLPRCIGHFNHRPESLKSCRTTHWQDRQIADRSSEIFDLQCSILNLGLVMDIVIHGGTLVTPDGPVIADLGITGETIAAIASELKGSRVIDATGKLVLPGAVDPHVHLQMPAGPVQSSDDWETGTIAAACGGTTTVIDFVEPKPARVGEGKKGSTGEGDQASALPPSPPPTLLPAFAARRAEAEGSAVIDFGLHMTILDASPATLAEIPAVVAAGCTSFKTYLTYAGFKLKMTRSSPCWMPCARPAASRSCMPRTMPASAICSASSWPKVMSSRATILTLVRPGWRRKRSSGRSRWPMSPAARCTSSTCPPRARPRR